MINEQIVSYVAGERARGVADDSIRGALLAQGWREEDVNSAMGGGVLAVASGPRAFSFGNLFEGRLGRWQFFKNGFLCSMTLALIHILLSLVINDFIVSIAISVVLVVAMIPITFSLYFRRAHDIGWSGWTSLIVFIPLVGGIFFLVLLFKKGTEGVNAYGVPQGDRPFLRTLLNT